MLILHDSGKKAIVGIDCFEGRVCEKPFCRAVNALCLVKTLLKSRKHWSWYERWLDVVELKARFNRGYWWIIRGYLMCFNASIIALTGQPAARR